MRRYGRGGEALSAFPPRTVMFDQMCSRFYSLWTKSLVHGQFWFRFDLTAQRSRDVKIAHGRDGVPTVSEGPLNTQRDLQVYRAFSTPYLGAQRLME